MEGKLLGISEGRILETPEGGYDDTVSESASSVGPVLELGEAEMVVEGRGITVVGTMLGKPLGGAEMMREGVVEIVVVTLGEPLGEAETVE